MLIREEAIGDQIKIFRKIDLKIMKKLLFYKPVWREVEDPFEKNRRFLFLIFVVKIMTQITKKIFISVTEIKFYKCITDSVMHL
jgi:hypothetical protein